MNVVYISVKNQLMTRLLARLGFNRPKSRVKETLPVVPQAGFLFQ